MPTISDWIRKRRGNGRVEVGRQAQAFWLVRLIVVTEVRKRPKLDLVVVQTVASFLFLGA